MLNLQTIPQRHSPGYVATSPDTCPQKVIAVAATISILGSAILAVSKILGATYLNSNITFIIVPAFFSTPSLITLIAVSYIWNSENEEGRVEQERRVEMQETFQTLQTETSQRAEEHQTSHTQSQSETQETEPEEPQPEAQRTVEPIPQTTPQARRSLFSFFNRRQNTQA
ncbi:MAG: hypothetical protein WAM28_00505 [Chlamydiales bacterium]